MTLPIPQSISDKGEIIEFIDLGGESSINEFIRDGVLPFSAYERLGLVRYRKKLPVFIPANNVLKPFDAKLDRIPHPLNAPHFALKQSKFLLLESVR